MSTAKVIPRGHKDIIVQNIVQKDEIILSEAFGKDPENVQFCNLLNSATDQPVEFKLYGTLHTLDVKTRKSGQLGMNLEPSISTRRTFEMIETLVKKSIEGSAMEVVPIAFKGNWYPSLEKDPQDWKFLTRPTSFPSDKQFPGKNVEITGSCLVVYNYKDGKVWLKWKFTDMTFTD